MYVFKNALANLKRHRKRNGLLSIIVLVLLVGISTSIVINNTTKAIIQDYQQRFGSDVSIDIDIEQIEQLAADGGGMMFEFEIDNITSKQYISFAKSDYIKSYSLVGSLGINFGDDITAVDEGEESEGEGGFIQFETVGGSEPGEAYTQPTGNVELVSDSQYLSYFDKGLRSLKEGEFFKEDNEVLVSEEFAKLNELEVGDTFELKGTHQTENTQVTVSGIYYDLTNEYQMPIVNAGMNRRNDILMSIDSTFAQDVIDNVYVIANYELKHPDYIEEFRAELTEKGLPSIYRATTDEYTYNTIVAPVLGLEKITSTFVWVILVVGSLILMFVQSLTIRERKYEIGVLRAMGMKKIKIARMFIYENVLITTICLVLGMSCGVIVSQPIADQMIETQIQVAEKNEQMNMSGVALDMNSMTQPAQPLSEINVQISSEAIMQIIGSSLVVVFMSSLIGVLTITRYEPMQILSERN